LTESEEELLSMMRIPEGLDLYHGRNLTGFEGEVVFGFGAIDHLEPLKHVRKFVLKVHMARGPPVELGEVDAQLRKPLLPIPAAIYTPVWRPETHRTGSGAVRSREAPAAAADWLNLASVCECCDHVVGLLGEVYQRNQRPYRLAPAVIRSRRTQGNA
jgi:hypothetical protein